MFRASISIFGPPARLSAVLVLAAHLFAGCRSNEQASYQTPPQGGAAYRPPSTVEQGSAPSPYPGLTGSVEAHAPVPVPVVFGGGPRLQGPPPTITAKAAILVDSQGRVLFEKSADARLPSASTQKLLLGLLVAERGNLGGTVTIETPDTWAEPTVIGLKAGEVYTREQLLRAVLIRSCNDIARALGRDHSGSEAAFVAAMNAKARQLGMTNSYFTNSNGLPSPPGQYSTARDLSRLGLAALHNPVVRQICATQSYLFRFSNGTTRTLTNTNQVLRHFPYCTGLKTGYTNAAGRCLVSSASAGGKTVVAVILGSSSPTVWQESEALLRYGLGM